MRALAQHLVIVKLASSFYSRYITFKKERRSKSEGSSKRKTLTMSTEARRVCGRSLLSRSLGFWKLEILDFLSSNNHVIGCQ